MLQNMLGFINLFKKIDVCTIDAFVNPQATVVTEIDFGPTNLLTIATYVTDLSSVTLSELHKK